MIRSIALLAVCVTLLGTQQLDAQLVQWPASAGGNDHWYEPVYVGSNTLWTYAQNVATAKGGYLASITSPAENSFVTNLVADLKYWDQNSSGTFGPWVGGYQPNKNAEPSGNWAWTSGEGWGYTNWSSGEPNNAYNREDYLQLGRSAGGQWGVWNDQMNSAEWCKVLGYVVEYNALPHANVQTRSFQQGANSYLGTADTMLSQAAPSTNFRSSATLQVCGASGASYQTLLRFDNIIGNGANQVPQNATIVSAMLQWRSTDTSDNTCELHRMLKSWSDSTATWNSLGNGVQADDIEAVSVADALVTPSGYYPTIPLTTCDVTASVQAWANGARTNGWVIMSSGGDQWSFDSSEGALHPILTVSYVIPEPSILVLMTVSAVGLLFFGRRSRKIAVSIRP